MFFKTLKSRILAIFKKILCNFSSFFEYIFNFFLAPGAQGALPSFNSCCLVPRVDGMVIKILITRVLAFC